MIRKLGGTGAAIKTNDDGLHLRVHVSDFRGWLLSEEYRGMLHEDQAVELAEGPTDVSWRSGISSRTFGRKDGGGHAVESVQDAVAW